MIDSFMLTIAKAYNLTQQVFKLLIIAFGALLLFLGCFLKIGRCTYWAKSRYVTNVRGCWKKSQAAAVLCAHRFPNRMLPSKKSEI